MGAIDFDVIVIGAGITGLSTIIHLIKHCPWLREPRIALSSDRSISPASSHVQGLLSGGQIDNFTRISHRHGQDVSAQLWNFGTAGYRALEAHCAANGVPVSRGARLRLITSNAELAEASQAVMEMTAAGISGVHLTPKDQHPLGKVFTDRVLAIQDEGEIGAAVPVGQLIENLLEKTKGVSRVGPVARIDHHLRHRPMRVITNDGTALRAEIVVIAAHLSIGGGLVPTLTDALVSYADQWLVKRDVPHGLAPGTIFSASHGHEWGGINAVGEIVYGGARYLRPLAGLEAKAADYEPRVKDRLNQLCDSTFVGAANSPPSDGRALLDIHPCDDLPVIGPMFGDPSLLVATGYRGQGLTMGFQAGAVLAQLIATGSAPNLPRILWPERLRSLEN